MTSEQEDQVRRVLGSLPPVGPLPPEVAERLDATLADLTAERSANQALSRRGAAEVTPGSPTDELAARRRRRWRTGLVAAASVAVLGVGIGTIADDLPLGGVSSDTAEDSAGIQAESGAGGSAPDAGADTEEGPAQRPNGNAGPPQATYLTKSRQNLSSDTLTRDIRRLAELSPVLGARSTAPQRDAPTESQDKDQALSALAPCDPPSTSRGDRLAAVRLDGQRATLVLRRADSGVREAQIYSCDDGDAVLASTVVPAD